MFLTRISVSQPVFTTMMMVAIMMFGIFAWRGLPIDEYPNVDVPVVVVMTTYPGATPETIEADVTDVIEEALASVSGIDEMTSTSTTGNSLVVLSFKLETPIAEAAQDVRDKVARITGRLPDDIDTPMVMRFDPNAQAIMSLALVGESADPASLTRLAEDVVSPTLTSINGVGAANIVGSVEEEVHILIDPDLLRANGLGVSAVTAALQAENLLASAGSIDDAVMVRSVQLNAEIRDLDALRGLVVRRSGDHLVRLGDVARIETGLSDRVGRAFLDGASSLAINVTKVEGGNTVAVADAIQEAVTSLNAGAQLEGARLIVVQDKSSTIRASYETVQATLIEGAVLAVAIVFLFLNSWRSTVITGLTLPISILGTLAVINWLGFTLNGMSMLALTLSIGILIDDAIVVRENITRHLHMGKDHFRASLDGTNEIGLAVLATTLSICAVFMPLALMDGMIGKFFLEFGVTVSVAVLISLFVSFTLDPMMSSVWYDPASQPDVKRGPVGRMIAKFEHGFDRVAQWYRVLLTWCLRHSILTMLFAVATLVGAGFMASKVGVEFVPAKDQDTVTITLKTDVGSSPDFTALKAEQVADLIRSVPEISSLYTTITSNARSGSNEAKIEAKLVALSERSKTSMEMVPVLREKLQPIVGATVRISGSSGVGPGGGSPVSLKISARSPTALAEGARQISEIIASTEGTQDVQLSIDDSQPVYDYVFLQEIARAMGIDAQSTGGSLRTLVAGSEVGEFERPDGIMIPIILRLPEKMRQDVRALGSLPVASVGNRSVDLEEVAELQVAAGAAKIEREDRTRVVTISANIEGRLLGDIMAEINGRIAAEGLPEGVSIKAGGQAKMMQEILVNIGLALVMAVICIYLVLASQFGSFLQPIGIMASLPLSLSGVVLGLWLWGSTFNMNSMIGCVMLMGLVVKNAILLVDNSNQRRREGQDLVSSLIDAGTTRFRPIIMTTLAMIAGMLPLAMAWHAGSEQQAPMAHAVIGGLVTSTLLTLVVVPIMMVWLDRVGRFAGRFLPKAPH